MSMKLKISVVSNRLSKILFFSELLNFGIHLVISLFCWFFSAYVFQPSQHLYAWGEKDKL